MNKFKKGDEILFKNPNYNDWSDSYNKYIGTTGVICYISGSGDYEVKFDIDGYKLFLFEDEIVILSILPDELFEM